MGLNIACLPTTDTEDKAKANLDCRLSLPRKQVDSGAIEAAKISAKQAQAGEERKLDLRHNQKGDDSQRNWILQYMEHDASDGDSDMVRLWLHFMTKLHLTDSAEVLTQAGKGPKIALCKDFDAFTGQCRAY